MSLIVQKMVFIFFQQLGKRKAAGKMKAAQILFALPAEASDRRPTRACNRKSADSVYAALKGGVLYLKNLQKL